MGLLNKKIKLTYKPDPKLIGALAWAGHVPMLLGPTIDMRPPDFQGHVGEVKNMMDMTIGRCLVKNGEPPALLGDALARALQNAGLRFAAPGEAAVLQLTPQLDVCWAAGRVEIQGIVEANISVTLHLSNQGQPWFTQPYQGLGRSESLWGMTKGVFQRALDQAVAVLTYYVATDQRLGQAICAAVQPPA